MAHSLKTYLYICLDREEMRPACEQWLSAFTDKFTRFPCVNAPDSYTVCPETNYFADVNELYRRTLSPFLGHEEEIKRKAEELGLHLCLQSVVCLDTASGQPCPILSPDTDIIAFCYLSGTAIDIDYYLISAP